MAWTPPRTWVTGELVTASMLNTHLRDNLLAAVPTGKYEYLLRAGTSVETLIEGAFLECNGVAVSRTTYAGLNTLLAALSYPFGSGNGSTTFNLPDFRGRTPVHQAVGGHTDVDGIGENEGAALAGRRQRHKHSMSVTDPGHFHSITPSGSDWENDQGGAEFALANGNARNSGPSTTGISVSAGPQTGNEPLDAGAFLVGGVWAVKI
jgi:microcystin-dependent protein